MPENEVVLSENSTSTERPNSPYAQMTDVLHSAVTLEGKVPWKLMGAAAGGVYVCLRLSFSIFYGALGFRPNEIGLTDIEMLAISTPILVFAGVSAAIASRFVDRLFLSPPLEVGGYLLWVRSDPRELRLAWSAVLLVGLGIASFYPSSYIPGWWWWVPMVLMIATGILIGISSEKRYIRMAALPGGAGTRALRTPHQVRTLTTIARFVMPVAVGITIIMLAYDSSQRLKQGVINTRLAMPFGGGFMRPALVISAGTTASPTLQRLAGHCTVFLGTSSGNVLLFDVTDQASVRLPSSSVIVTVDVSGRPYRPPCISAGELSRQGR